MTHWPPPSRLTYIRGSRCSKTAPLRPLGAFEQVFHLYAQRYPVHFSLTAHLAYVVGEDDVRRATAVLQRVHPLLAATITDDVVEGRYQAYYHHSRAVVSVTTVAGATWEDVAAQEQARPFTHEAGPLWRVTLCAPPAETLVEESNSGTTLVLTLDHRIADGRSGLRVLTDLLSVLVQKDLPAKAVVPSQDDLLATVGESRDELGQDSTEGQLSEPSAPAGAPVLLRIYDNSPPSVSSLMLTVEATRQLRRACRDRGTTVHSALGAALSVALAAAGRDPARIVHPTDLRGLFDLGDAVGLCISPAPAVTSFAGAADRGVVELAGAINDQLNVARRPAVVLAAAKMLKDHLASTPDEAVAGMLAMTRVDAMLTNLGIVELKETTMNDVIDREGVNFPPVISLRALAMSTEISGEQVVGALTYRGQLRLTNTSHEPVPGLLERVAQELHVFASSA